MAKISKTGKMDRFKANWKKIGLGIVALGGIIYFVLTGEEIDLTFIQGLLQ
jgi:hypothetical protein